MLNVHQISNAAADVSMGEMSVEEFERWFRRGSRDCHAWGDADFLSAALSVESVLSEYRFGNLEEDKVGLELENAVRPFVSHRSFAIQWTTGSISLPQQITLQYGPRFASVLSKSLSVPRMLELSHI